MLLGELSHFGDIEVWSKKLRSSRFSRRLTVFKKKAGLV